MVHVVLKQEQDRTKRDRLSLILSVVAVLAIAGIGSFLLKLQTKNNSTIVQPVTDVIYEQPILEENVRININTAQKEELMLLNGIGESKAENIILYRQQTPFTSIKDIIKVTGIGEKIYKEIADKICVE